MDIKTAINKAIEGGYKKGTYWLDNWLPPVAFIICSDPLFWQSLGKAMGWGKNREIQTPRLGSNVKIKGEWFHYWHRLIDHLAEGRSIESFFEELK